jgi:predicted nucleic acid-binding protein
MLVTAMYQVVIDTNVFVAALRSNRGASHRLLRLVTGQEAVLLSANSLPLPRVSIQ